MKKLLLTLIAVMALGFANQGKAATALTEPKDTTEVCNDYFSWESINHMVCYAQDFIGTPYKYGSMSLTSFDCSGFTSYVFKQFGISLPRSAREQATLGTKVDNGSARKGDLIFFKGHSTRSTGVGHVGIVISECGDMITFIHASVHKGITIDTINLKYYKDRFLYIKRVLNI